MLLLFVCPLEGAAQEDGDARASVNAQIDEVLGGLDFSALSDMQLGLPGQSGVRSVAETVRALALGDALSPEYMLTGVLRLFGSQAARLGALMLAIMLPVRRFLGFRKPVQEKRPAPRY